MAIHKVTCYVGDAKMKFPQKELVKTLKRKKKVFFPWFRLVIVYNSKKYDIEM